MHSIYKCYDANNRLLYVGIGNSALTRIQSHQREKPWFDDVTNIIISKIEDKATALIEEARCIREEKPAFNIASGGDGFKVHLETHKLFMRRMKYSWVQITQDQYYFFRDVIDNMIEIGLLEQEDNHYSYRLVDFSKTDATA